MHIYSLDEHVMSHDHINTSISGLQQYGKTKTHTGLEEVQAIQRIYLLDHYMHKC